LLVQERLIERREISKHDTVRPAIADNVVHRDQQDMLFSVQLEQLTTNKRTGGQAQWLRTLKLSESCYLYVNVRQLT
jgi:hypothetical protein